MLIRKKILFITVLLTVMLLMLMYSSLQGVYAYRNLTLMVRELASKLEATSNLRVELDELLRLSRAESDLFVQLPPLSQRSAFRDQIRTVESELNRYEGKLASYDPSDRLLAEQENEKACVARMRQKLDDINWGISPQNPDSLSKSVGLGNDVQQLVEEVQELPRLLMARMRTFRDEVRSRYRTLIFLISSSSLAALGIVLVSFWFFRSSVVQPFKMLLEGSRVIARGNHQHRIQLDSHDELKELAESLNKMTSNFVEIEQNLNEKVQQRTREVVRSEQLASVGFLAAGVAHEINNPLASIAWSAEALESRVHEILHPSESERGESKETHIAKYDDEQIDVLRTYLRRIQDEAFRCKGITERLLDFSRLGETQKKQATNVSESIRDVVELVKHLGQYRNKTIHYWGPEEIIAKVSPTELKQVALNLFTNALDSCDDGGIVNVRLSADEEEMTLSVIDNGCGMTSEVQQHLFEPFYTRRRDGRGTGLGLSISYRIVQDHGGSLVPQSAGPDTGSQLTLILPLNSTDSDTNEGFQEAA